MAQKLTEMLKGILEGLVLEIISHQATYGYEITQTLNRLGFTEVVEGTVYTILLRLEKDALVITSKRPSAKGPMRKFYQLNSAGQAALTEFWERWGFLTAQMAQIKSTLEAQYHD